jgi:hypothetical protein
LGGIVYEDLFAQLDGLDEGVQEDNLGELTLPELLEERERLDEQLATMKEVLARAPTAAARELHSRRAAVVVLINKRRS